MIQEASAMGLLRTILIILLIWFGLRILARLFAPILIKFAAKKAEERFGQQFGGFQNQSQQRKDEKRKAGETVIDKMPEQNKPTNEKVGEYIDFEELD
jgi:hypothetical protein